MTKNDKNEVIISNCNSQFKLDDVSKYRQELFGISIISVILFHYFEGVYKTFEIGAIKSFAGLILGAIGSVGVDIFLFLSGFGIYYSLTKHFVYKSFFIKRLQRVVIPYFVFGFLFWIVQDLVILHKSIGRFLYDYSLLSFWFEGIRTFWYIAFISLLYLISPAIYSKGPNGILTTSIIWIIICICLYIIAPVAFKHVEIALCRGPIYFIGMYVAHLVEKRKDITINMRHLFLALSLSIPIKIIATLSGFALRRLFNGLYGMFLITMFIFFRKTVINSDNVFFRFLVLAGEYSLELYITHVAIRTLMGALHCPLYNPFCYILLIVISIILSIALFSLQKKHIKR